MQDAVKNNVEYTVIMISEFAKKHSLDTILAYKYLKRFKGIALLKDHYAIMHTLPMDDALNSLTLYCKNNGGLLV